MIEIGAGESIPTIRSIGERIVLSNEINRMVRINPQNKEGIYRNIITIKEGAVKTLKHIQQSD